MARIILTVDDTVLHEIPLAKERISIGRRSHNDLVIDDLAISSEHAAIVTIRDDSFLEDLDSTNGTQVNGQPVKKHFLQDNDVIGLAQYKITYLAGDGQPACTSPEPAQADQRTLKKPDFAEVAVIRVINGASAGKEIALTKALTTIGRPGVQVAVVTRRPQGYCLTHVEGDARPFVNGLSIGTGVHTLADNDVIDLSGTSMRFLAR